MESRVGTLVENKIKSMIQSVMVPMLEQKLFQIKGDIIQSIETMIKNQHQDPIINSKSQPSSVQDLNNSDPTSNDTENVSSLKPSKNKFHRQCLMFKHCVRVIYIFSSNSRRSNIWSRN